VRRVYAASGGAEHFVSIESADRATLLGFVRLRLPPPWSDAPEHQPPFEELRGAALVRELHVYGQLIATADKSNADAQHTGLGRTLMAEAEATARAHGFRRVAVIAGVGSRGYYRRLGYALDPRPGLFMMKESSSSRHFMMNGE